jgi:hypothetical protein
LVTVLGLVLASCDGPSRGTNTQPTAASGFLVIVSASPNTLRGATPGTDEAQGGCATIQVKVFDSKGRLVDGAIVTVTTTLGRFPPQASPPRPESVGVTGLTIRGNFADVLCAKAERGTAIVTATVEDATASTQITIY